MTPLILTASLALAESDSSKGYYNETEIAKKSTLFVEASKISAPSFAEAQRKIKADSEIIHQMELNCALTGSTELQAWFTPLQKKMIGYRILVSQHATAMTNDYDAAFSSAMSEAIQSLSTPLTVCESNGIQAMLGAAAKCDGTDYSSELAQIMDQNAKLQGAVEGINQRPWPHVEIEIKAQPVIPITGTQAYIRMETLQQHFLQDRIKSHKAWLEKMQEPLIEGIEDGNKDALQKAQSLRQEYLKRIESDGQTFQKLLTEYTSKRQGKYSFLGQVGICGNVKDLGGCDGVDKTDAFLQLTSEDRYWQKRLRKLDW